MKRKNLKYERISQILSTIVGNENMPVTKRGMTEAKDPIVVMVKSEVSLSSKPVEMLAIRQFLFLK